MPLPATSTHSDYHQEKQPQQHHKSADHISQRVQLVPPPPPPPGPPPVELRNDSDIESVEMEDTDDISDHLTARSTSASNDLSTARPVVRTKAALKQRPEHISERMQSVLNTSSSSQEAFAGGSTPDRSILPARKRWSSTEGGGASDADSLTPRTKPPRVRKSRFGPPLEPAQQQQQLHGGGLVAYSDSGSGGGGSVTSSSARDAVTTTGNSDSHTESELDTTLKQCSTGDPHYIF